MLGVNTKLTGGGKKLRQASHVKLEISIVNKTTTGGERGDAKIYLEPLKMRKPRE